MEEEVASVEEADLGRGAPMDPMKRAQKSGAIIAPTENKVPVLDDSDDE